MSRPAQIHLFNHHTMATHFQVRIAGQDPEYAAQAARAALDLADALEGLLSRFQETSEISQIAQLQPGQRMRLSEPVFACLEIARDMQIATQGAFSVTPRVRQTPGSTAHWSLDPTELSICCEEGRLEMDLGAIGKGFALDRMAGQLAEWECPAYLLIAGGSSILAGAPPQGMPGWDTGVGNDDANGRFWLAHGSLSGSGVAVKGLHILDPRTGVPATQRPRAWVVAPSAAMSDALSTAWMVLSEAEIAKIETGRPQHWRALSEDGANWQVYGDLPAPDELLWQRRG